MIGERDRERERDGRKRETAVVAEVYVKTGGV